HSSSEDFTWTVVNVLLANPGDQSSADGNSVALQLQGHAAGGSSLTYSAVGLPPGLSINSGTGLISGMLTAASHSGGPYLVTVTAAHGTDSDSQTFLWHVGHIGLLNPGDRSDLEGATVSLPLTASDPDGDPLTYTAV